MIIPPDSHAFEAHAMIVDINGSTRMVRRADADNHPIAEFTSDVLIGGIQAVEHAGGEVVAFMGDAFLAILPTAESAYLAAVGVAVDVNKQCEYMAHVRRHHGSAWPFARGGPTLKIAVEHGFMQAAEIASRSLGTQRLLAGPAINYAHRISAAGAGNRCVCGPATARQLVAEGHADVVSKGRVFVDTREGRKLKYFEIDLSDCWVPGKRGARAKTHLD